MNYVYCDSGALLTAIKQRAAIPTDQTNFTDNSLLVMADEELTSVLFPAIIKHREEWCTYDYDQTLVAGQDSYRLPPRAYGGKIRMLCFVDSAGRKYYPTRIGPERSQDFTNFGTSAGIPTHYYLKHGSVVLEPTPSASTGTLRITYYLRPSSLTTRSDVAVITEINTTTNTITFNPADTDWTPTAGYSGINTFYYDLMRGSPDFDVLATDQILVSATSSTATFSSLPEGLVVGDIMVPAAYTLYPNIPPDLCPILAQMVACRVIGALGFLDEKKAAQDDLAEMLDAAGIILQTRDEGSSLKVTAKAGK